MAKKNSDSEVLRCSFCNKDQNDVRKLIAGPTVFICDECVDVCNDIIADDNRSDTKGELRSSLPVPQEVKKFLDQYVIGQERTKKKLAVAVYNHYKRVEIQKQSKNRQDTELTKSNILLIGHILGVEERALELVSEIENRMSFVADQVPSTGDSERPAVIATSRYADSIYVAGSDTTEGGIVEGGGGVNAAARDGVVSHQVVSIESIAAMNPDVILIVQPVEFGANEFRDEMLSHPALASVPAIADNEIHVVDSRKFTTFSHWNVRGIEQTAQLLYPDRFSDVTFEDFEPFSGE